MVEELIKSRRSCRRFDPKPIKNILLTELLETARFAPSGKNRQPWKVRILRGEVKDDFLLLFADAFKGGDLPGSLGLSLDAIRQSGATLLIFNPYSYTEEDYSLNRRMMDTQSIGAFIQNLLLVASEKGLSSLWINDIYYAKAGIEKKYGNGELEIVAAVALGYSSETRRFNLRKDVDEFVLN